MWSLKSLRPSNARDPHATGRQWRRRPALRGQVARRWYLEALEDRCLLSFSPAVSYPVGPYPQAVVTADFNGDGRADLAAANSGDGTVSLLLGTGDGSFQAARTSPGGGAIVAAGDFNGDGNADLVAGDYTNTFSILLATGDGTFGPPVPVASTTPVVGTVRAAAVGDFDADGRTDLVLTGWYNINAGESPDGAGFVQVLRGNGDGTFAVTWTDGGVGMDPASVALADLNRDGHLDVVAGETHYSAQGVYVLLGNGDGSCRPATWWETGAVTPLAVAAADFNGDGKPDLVTNNGAGLAILTGNGDGTFQAARYSLSGGYGLAITDFDGDGKLDLAGAGPDGVGVQLGNGDGTLRPPTLYTTGLAPQAVAAADFNGDGRPDLATTNNGSGNVSILVNDANWPPPGAPSISVADAFVTEGNTGTRAITFTVRLSAAFSQAVTVDYATANGTASAGSDYQARGGTLSFAPGQTSMSITVLVYGDRLGEDYETFVLNLGGATNAMISNGQGVATIVDDEPRISISDVIMAEGRKGQTTLFTFTVTLSAAYDQAVTTSFRTADGTARTSDGDYLARSGTLTFAPGETTKTITIQVNGDSRREADETFTLELSGAGGNASFLDAVGLGTIGNDDSGSGLITGVSGKRSIFDGRKKPRR